MKKFSWFKAVVFLLCLAPAVYLAWQWYTNDLGINRIEYVARYSGRWTLRMLIATLAISPLRRLPKLNSLIKIRRMLGLFTFFYACCHGFHYVAVDLEWDWSIFQEDLTYRRFFIAGATALLLMTPLALTSFRAAIVRLGGKRWKMLHWLIYPAAIAASIHYLWQAKGLDRTPLEYFLVIIGLLAVRVVMYAWRKYLSPRKAPTAR